MLIIFSPVGVLIELIHWRKLYMLLFMLLSKYNFSALDIVEHNALYHIRFTVDSSGDNC